MSAFELDAVATRVLGCLIEKERVTPENYPLSLHALTTACNQSTNRDPVTEYDEKTVEAGVNVLREKKLATVIFGAGSRVQKYRHKLLDHYNLEASEVALICVLLLRGPQTPGELRARTERLHPFESSEAVEAALNGLAQGEAALVQLLPPRAGQKERRYLQLLSAPTSLDESASEMPETRSARSAISEPSGSRMDALEEQVRGVRAELEQVRAELREFRRQFE